MEARMDSPSESEKKRKLACDSCRRKKMKCEWDAEDVCNRCKERQINCIPHPIQTKRKERKPNTYLASLEDRLKRMEEAIRKPSVAAATSRRPSVELQHQSIPDSMSSAKVHADGTTMFLDSSSGFSIVSPTGLKWISDRTGNDDFEKFIAKMPNVTELESLSDPKVWAHVNEEELEPMPSRGRAKAHFDCFFHDGFNNIFPVFDEKQVRERFSREYPLKPSEDYAWYASLNMIFSISELIHGKFESPSPAPGSPATPRSSRGPNIQATSCWKWFKNAASTFNRLQFLEGSLPACQAMIAMCFILQTTPNAHASLVVAGAALRLAQSIGLHRYLPHLQLPPEEIEHRRNVFWVGLVIERQINVRMGRPSVIHDDDIGVDLPKASQVDPTRGHLRYMSQIMLIQGKIYNSLYSAKSLSKSRLERLQSVGLLDEEVEYWRQQLPLSLQPDSDIQGTEETLFPTIMMHFAYFDSLTMIHRVSGLTGGPWAERYGSSVTKSLEESDVNPRVLSGGSICLEAARGAIRLLNSSPLAGFNDLNMVRVIAYYPLSATLTIFTSVLHNPRHPEALQDLELMNSVIEFLVNYMDEEDPMGEFVMEFFREIFRTATQLVLKAQRAPPNDVKMEVVENNIAEFKVPMRPREATPETPVQPRAASSHVSFTSPQYILSPETVNSAHASPYLASPFNGQVYEPMNNQPQFNTMQADPMNLLEHNPGYHTNIPEMNFDQNWINGGDVMMQSDLFINNDASWFMPWDPNLSPNFPPGMDPNAMQ